MSYLSNASWGEGDPTFETKKMALALHIRQSAKSTNQKAVIIDAGAGLGRNSIFLAKNGFNIQAVEYDSEAIPSLTENVNKNHFQEKINIIHSSILDFLSNCPDNSVDGLLDSGMSHYLSYDEKQKYFDLLRQKLKSDAIFCITHFSEIDPTTSLCPVTKAQLLEFIGNMLPIEDLYQSSWESTLHTGVTHSFYNGLFVAKNNTHNQNIAKEYKKVLSMIQSGNIKSLEELLEFLQNTYAYR